jgi:iron complex outermembrane receptor protein
VFILGVIYSSLLFSQNSDSVKTYFLPEISVTSNRFVTNIKDLSTSVEIIDEKRIHNSNGGRLSDILNTSSKVFLKSYGSTPLLQTISMNGLGSEHTLILIDGIKLNSFQNSMFDLSLLNLDNVSRIEILNNGSSSIYGSDAIGGVINIITDNIIDSDSNKIFNLQLLASKGSYNTNKYSIKVAKPMKNFRFSFSYNKETSDGNFEYKFDNGISKQLKKRENSAYGIEDVSLILKYIIDNSTRLKYYSSFSNHDKQIPGLETGTPSALTKQLDKNWNNIFLIEKSFSQGIFLTNKLNYQNNLMNYKTIPLINSFYKNLVYSISSDLNIETQTFSTVFGYEFINASLQSNEVEEGARRNIHSLYISSGIDILNSIKIYPSTRMDFYSDLNDNVFTYKVGLNYQPFNKAEVRLKANIGKNFRAPTFNDLYWKESGNKNLNPEKSFNSEFGIFYGFKSFLDGYFELHYNIISAKDKIVWVPQRNFIWMPVNIAESESKNLFLSINLNKNFDENFNCGITAGVSFIRSVKTSENFKNDPTLNKYFPYIPLESSKINLTMEYENFSANLFFNHYDRRYSDFENKKTLSPYNILDGNLSGRIKLFEFYSELKLEVNNILNTDYQVILGYPMPLRNYKLTLSINY